MNAQVMPTRQDLARYSFSIELDGATFQLSFEWNDRDAGWYFSIADTNGVPLLSGRRIVLNYPLINIYRDARLPAGTFMALDSTGTGTEAGLSDLGARVKLFYIPVADLV